MKKEEEQGVGLRGNIFILIVTRLDEDSAAASR